MTSTLPNSSPYTSAPASVSRVMLKVIYAMIPGSIAHVYFFGWGLLINMTIALMTALLAESVVMQLRKRPTLPALFDGSATVTALLLALAIPPLAPWWLPMLGSAFAILVAKHLYGGLGFNPFNPAMVGYAMLLIAFPQNMTAWIPPHELGNTLSFMQTLDYSMVGTLPANQTLDAITMASPLDTLKTQLMLDTTVSQILLTKPVFSGMAGIGWEWVNLMFLLGGIWLLLRRVITWHIPVAVLAGLGAMSALAWLIDSNHFATPVFHWLSGASMLGAFFIATDPVTACTTPRGQLVYGALMGVLIYIIRVWGGYPDGVAFAVLLLNMAVPTIDYYTQPRVFGHGGK